MWSCTIPLVSAMCFPAGEEPVIAIASTRSSPTRTSPMALARPGTNAIPPAGRSGAVSTTNSVSSAALSGVFDAGFNTTALPAARAGATWSAVVESG